MNRDRRVCVVVMFHEQTCQGRVVEGGRVEYRYERTAGGMGRHRGTPVQSLELSIWRGIFTRPAP